MADIDQQTEEALGWAAEGKKLAVDIPEVSFKDAATFVASATPIIGDAMAAKEVYDELQKDEPNYYLAGALGGAALVGLVPGLGDAAAKAIKKGAKEVFDVSRSVPKVSKTKPEEFSGTIRLQHGYRGNKPTEFVPQAQYKGDRYDSDGGVFGDKPLYMEDPDNPAFLGDSQVIPFSYDDVVDVDASFDRAFVLTPDTVDSFNKLLKDIDTLDTSTGPKIVDKLEELGYDGLIIRGFPDPTTSPLGKLREEQSKVLRGVGRDREKGRSIVQEYAPKIEELRRAEGIDEMFQQPQALALRPEKQKVIKKYAEGGAVMNNSKNQMEMLFDEGGIADDGMNVDPVSGNEIPPGSMPEEVRDDIPAQLSEGEYVVPADVVRFFGVKFFEDIRNEAKRGFADMEANGRIGGEPIGMEMAEDELPFDISELQIVDDETEEQPMMNMGGYMRGYADGGLTLPSAVTDMTEATGVSSSASGVPMPASNLSGIEMREYVGPSGEIMYIQFINGVAQSVIPEGYTAKAAAPTAPPGLGGPVPAPVVQDNDNDDPFVAPEPREAIDWTSPDVGIEQYEKTLDQNNSMLAKGFSGLATMLGGPIVGGFMAIAKRHQNKKMLEGATARLEDPNVKGAERDKWVSIHNRLSGLDEDGKARNSFTEGLANLLTPDDGMEYVNGVLVETATGKVLKPGIANSKGNDVVAPTPTPKPQGGGSSDSDTHTTAVNAARAAATERSQKITSQDMSGKSTGYKTAAAKKATSGITKGTSSSTAADNTTAGGAALDTSYGISGLNKGGLMKKKKK